MGDQIDLSAGFVPKQPPAIDLSAGLVPKQQPAQQTLDPNQSGMQPKPSAFYSDLKGMVTGAPEAIGRMTPGPDLYYKYKDALAEIESLKSTGKTRQQLADESRKQAGYGLPYRIVAPVGEQLGVNAQGMEQAAREGDQAAVMGHAAAAVAPYVAGAIGGEVMRSPAGVKASSKVANAATTAVDTVKSVPDKWAAYKSAPQIATMPADIGRMPPRVVLGAEDIYRAAAPTGNNPGFRANVYAAAPDLADIARKIDLSEAKGGMIRPDMRVRATADAISQHLDEMYKTERAPQIQAHADAPVDIPLGDATRGLEFIKRSGGTLADQALADKAIKTGTLTLAEADQLAMTANQYLKSFESMTPSEKLEAISKTPKIGGLKALDVALGKNMNEVLTGNGEVGLRDYERRFAALAEIRDQLTSRANATELKQPGMIKGVIQPIAKVLTGGTSGVASASQAAIADVGIGKTLQRGLKSLAGSDIGKTAPKR